MRISILTFGAIASVLTINAFAVSSTVTSRDYVDNALETKQDTIETGLVEFNGEGDVGVADLPAIVTYDSTDGLTGNKIGILDQETVMADTGDLVFYGVNPDMDHFVPTVRAVAESFQIISNDLAKKQNKIPKNDSTTNPNGSLVTYGTSAGNPGAKKIVTSVASGGTDIPTDGAVYAAVNTRQAKKTCAGWPDGTTTPDSTHTDANCWLWNLPD